jgi:hypothetical protein
MQIHFEKSLASLHKCHAHEKKKAFCSPMIVSRVRRGFAFLSENYSISSLGTQKAFLAGTTIHQLND